LLSNSSQGRLDFVRRKRDRTHPRARRIEHRVRDGRRDRASHRLTRTPRDRPWTIDKRRLISAEDKGVTFKWKDYRTEGPGR